MHRIATQIKSALRSTEAAGLIFKSISVRQ
jgi:hypothetical protein